MNWALVIVAGLLETGWAVGLKYTHGFTRPVPSILTVAAIVASMALLAFAVRTLPVGTAYAVWVGIGAGGAALLGMAILGEPVTPGRIAFLVLLLISVAGLKFTSGE